MLCNKLLINASDDMTIGHQTSKQQLAHSGALRKPVLEQQRSDELLGGEGVSPASPTALDAEE